MGFSYGVSSIGRSFDWTWSAEPKSIEDEETEEIGEDEEIDEPDTVKPLPTKWVNAAAQGRSLSLDVVPSMSSISSKNSQKLTLSLSDGVLVPHLPSAPHTRPTTPAVSLHSPSIPGSPRYRRRSSQRQFSLVAGRLHYTPPPSPPPDSASEIPIKHGLSAPGPKLLRLASTSSFMSVNSVVVGPPTPGKVHYAGDRSISEFVLQGDVGRGAYGLVKRGREVMADGSYGPEVIIKQVIKSRILADCWKKHPVHGTIPIEIYVMLAVSSATYALPPPRPWDATRKLEATAETEGPPDAPVGLPLPDGTSWEEGKLVTGHPNICPLIDFFEDKNYYYLILPSALPPPDAEPRPKDLFDLVEIYPEGLPAHLVRSYLGQIADAMAFLHNRGIVHRDIKDENVILNSNGDHCWLIDFGSAGVVRKSGWNSFSGTLDYASPEILRGEFYTGREQDVWAYGVVAFVLLCGECPFATAQDAQGGLIDGSPAWERLDVRCGNGKEREGLEPDGGGALADAASLVRACLQVAVHERPTFEELMTCRFLAGGEGWTGERPPRSPASLSEAEPSVE